EQGGKLGSLIPIDSDRERNLFLISIALKLVSEDSFLRTEKSAFTLFSKRDKKVIAVLIP
ncbi:hypothetical protein, partial [Vibrio anguillarum]